MQIPALQQELVVRALGWTFVHSLWQGLLLAVLAGLVMLLTKHARAGLRYNLLVMLVALFLCGTGYTFVSKLRQAAPAPVTAVVTTGNTGMAYPVNNVLLVAPDEHAQGTHPRFADRFSDYFNAHVSLVVLVWLIIFSAKLVRLLANLWYVQRIRYYKTYDPAAYWKERVQALAAGLRIRQRIQLLQSEIVQVPVVIGALKPVILVPLGILSQLPAEQVEAILLHELAHIKRRDYLVNLLQSVAETIFFFNPAVWWVSSLIRDERENCCDDIAVAGTRSKTAFLDALVSFQEYNNGVSKYGMAFPGRKNHLLNRVKRILHEKNKTLNTMEKSLLTFSIAIILLLTLTTARQVQAQIVKKDSAAQAGGQPPKPVIKHDHPVPPAPPAIAPAAPVILIDAKPTGMVKLQGELIAPVELAPPPPVPIVAEVPLTGVQIAAPVIINDVPGPVIINDVPGIPIAPVVLADTMEPRQKDFTHVSSSISDDGKTKKESLEATDKEGKNYRITKLNNAVTGLWVNGEEIPKEKYAGYQSLIEKLDRARDNNWQRSRDRKLRSQEIRLQNIQIRQDKKWVMQQNRQQSEAIKIARANSVRKVYVANEPVIKKSGIILKQGFAPKEATSYQPVKVEVIVSPYEARKPFPATARKSTLFTLKATQSAKPAHEADAAAELEHQKKLMRELVDDLVKDEIIKSEKRLESMGLSDTEMMVNGKKQPDDIQQKYRARYITRPGFGLFYGPVRMTGKGYFLGKDEL